MKSKSIYVVVFILVIVFYGCGKKPVEEKPVLLEAQKSNEINTVTATKKDISSTEVYQAEVIPYIEELSFQVNGLLDEVYVKTGSKVKKGELLAKLKSSTDAKIDDYNTKKNELSATYMQELNSLQNDIEIAKLTGGSTDEMELKLKHAEELYQLESTQLENRISSLKKKQTKKPEIIAPFDGEIVAGAEIEKGSYVNRDTSFLAIVDPDKLQIACNFIAESNIENADRYYAIIDGKEYALEYTAYSEEEIGKQIEEKIQNNVMAKIDLISKFSLTAADSSVQAGSYAVVCIVKAHRENVLSLPVNAIKNDASLKYVFTMVNGERVKTSVTVGLTDFINIEILSGIEEGATVYVNE